MAEKIDHHQRSLAIIDSLKGKKPRLLLHVCCAPCACHPLRFLLPYFEVSIIFNNSNIYPKAEYEHRLSELRRLLSLLAKEENIRIPLIVPPYENEAFDVDLAPYAEEKEGGQRCLVCFRKRLSEGMRYAKEHGYSFFTTALTVSPYKNAQVLNAIGSELEAQYPGVSYFYSDFKKRGGTEIGRQMARRYHLYEQDYCGCRYSLAAKERRS